jgi:SAM-dependent methyltransferase
MSIIRAAARLIIREHAAQHFTGRALSLGVPETHATLDEIQDWYRECNAGACHLDTSNSEITTNAIGQSLKFLSGRSFLRSFGFSAVDTLDIPGCEHPPEILHDLNDPLPASMDGLYDFVLDPGTLEHVFDQRTCLINIARFLKPGGTVCHLVPIYSYNGGYFSINPNVLMDFYSQNGFEKPSASILMWDRYWAYSRRKTYCYKYDDAVMSARHAISDKDQVRYTPHLLLFARKRESVVTFVSPLQHGGNYVEDASAPGATRSLELERRGKKVAKIAFQLLPFNVAFYLQTAAYRTMTYFRARRAVGFKI